MLINSFQNLIGAIRSGGLSIIMAGLLAWHKYLSTETSTTRAVDYSPIGTNKGTLYSGVGLSFDGINDELIWSDITLTGDFTICCHVKSSSSGTYILTPVAGSSLLRLYASGILFKSEPSGNITIGTSKYVDGVANFIVFKRSGSTVSISKNNVLDATTTNSDTFKYGKTLYAGAKVISSIVIYDRCLTDEEITNLYLYPESKPSATNLKLWLQMDEGTGPIALDSSGNNNHATNNGGTWVTGVDGIVPQTALKSWNKYRELKNSTSSYAYISDLNPSGSFSMKWDFIINGNTGQTVLMARYNGGGSYVRYLGTGGDLYVYFSGITSNLLKNVTGLSRNVKNTLLITYDLPTTTFKIYVNSSLFSSDVVEFGGFLTKLNGFNRYAGANGVDGLVLFDFKYYEDSTQTTLVGRWNGIDFQDKVGSNHGTIVGTPTNNVLIPEGLTTNTDIIGNTITKPRTNGLNLDGNGYGQIADDASLNSVKSFSIWVNPSSTTCDIWNIINGSVSITASGGTISATGFTSPTIYVNGVVSSTLAADAWQMITVTTATAINVGVQKLGKVAGSVAIQVDKDLMYSVELTADQVLNNYNAQL